MGSGNAAEATEAVNREHLCSMRNSTSPIKRGDKGMTSRGTIAARICYSHGNADRRYLHVAPRGIKRGHSLSDAYERHELSIHLFEREGDS